MRREGGGREKRSMFDPVVGGVCDELAADAAAMEVFGLDCVSSLGKRALFNEGGVEICDSETSELLGALEMPGGLLKVVSTTGFPPKAITYSLSMPT